MMGHRMMNIGSMEKKKIASGPLYFSGDLDDEQDFPEPNSAAIPSVDSRECRVAQTVTRKSKPSRARREKTKRIPLKEFLGDTCDVDECGCCENNVPPPPEPEEVFGERVARADRRKQKKKFAPVPCSEECCTEREPIVIDQRDMVDFKGSNQELPPVADDDRQMMTSEEPTQHSKRRHIESKPQTVVSRWTRMSGAEKIQVRQAQRLIEKQTGIPRDETNMMQVPELLKLSSEIQADMDERAQREQQEREDRDDDPGMMDDSDSDGDVSEWNGSVYSAFGDTEDEAPEGDGEVEVDGWDSEAEVGKSTFSEYGDWDEERESVTAEDSFRSGEDESEPIEDSIRDRADEKREKEEVEAPQRFRDWVKTHPKELQ